MMEILSKKNCFIYDRFSKQFIHNSNYYIDIAPIHDTVHNSGTTFKTPQLKSFW